jgi:formylglycine-generating enzyme
MKGKNWPDGAGVAGKLLVIGQILTKLPLMHRRSATHRTLTWFFLLGFAFSLPGPLSLLPSVEAASASASKRIIKKLQKQIATSKAQLAAATATPAPFIEMVTVGNPGNTVDPSDGDSLTGGTQNFGVVPYEFQIGKFEVTLAHYAAFLNAVAATDAFGLFNASMATDLNIAGITRSGTSGSFTYSVSGDGARPVSFVSWFDAARFCNWLHNGRPTGAQTAATTENGAYPLNGATSGGLTITRNPGAKYWIPSEDEWYKAAYHQPSGEGGDGDNYWLYPTKSNAVPGNTIGSSANHANLLTTVYSVTQSGSLVANQNYLTAVGSYPGSASFYGTFDQGGNVFEWNDAVVLGSFRGLRGGSWTFDQSSLSSSGRDGGSSDGESNFVGFRVAGAVPPAATAGPAPLPKVSTSGPSARVIKALKKQVKTLKAQLAAATAVPAPFVEMVKVGNAGNAADPSDGDSVTGGTQNFGAVPYEFQIGKFEVTLAQYAAFLNAVAATDTHGLYDANLATDPPIAGIAQNGSSGSFTYSVIGTGTRPVTLVSWFDAARFCNWLHNGRPTGAQTAATTENGAYPLNGVTTGGVSITRNPGARFWIPSENEWYKAAYHDPRTAASGGPAGDDFYWLYPTKSDAAPGNTIGSSANHANFQTSVYSVTQSGSFDANQNYLTAVGSYPGSAGFYGTFDQGGNVWEWNDAVIRDSIRGLRGGSWEGFEFSLRSSFRGDNVSDFGNITVGFRVASP